MRALLQARLITVNVIELQKSLSDSWKFFRSFFNTLTAKNTYSLNSKDKWMQTIQMHLSQKQKIFAEFFLAFLESALNFEHFPKKRWPSSLIYFRNCRPRKTCLDKCLNAPVWEGLSTGDMVNSPKHWFNLNESAFTSPSNHCEINWVAKDTLRHMKILQTFS